MSRPAKVGVKANERGRQARQGVEPLARGDKPRADKVLDRMCALEWLEFDALYEAWASEGQKTPPEDCWRTRLMMGGRGFGKTRAGSEWVHSLAKRKRCRIALVGATIDDARRVMVEGPSGVIATAMSANRMTLKWEPSQRKLTWPTAARQRLFRARRAMACAGRNMTLRGALALLDGCVAACVEQRALASPPAAPVAGKCYIVAGGASGAWAGKADQLAIATEGGWRFVVPREGLRAMVASQGIDAMVRDGTWIYGEMRASSLVVGGDQVVGARASAVADATGGTTIDIQARAVLASLLASLRVHGLIAS